MKLLLLLVWVLKNVVIPITRWACWFIYLLFSAVVNELVLLAMFFALLMVLALVVLW